MNYCDTEYNDKVCLVSGLIHEDVHLYSYMNTIFLKSAKKSVWIINIPDTF